MKNKPPPKRGRTTQNNPHTLGKNGLTAKKVRLKSRITPTQWGRTVFVFLSLLMPGVTPTQWGRISWKVPCLIMAQSNPHTVGKNLLLVFYFHHRQE